jgi:hypothetical protein
MTTAEEKKAIRQHADITSLKALADLLRRVAAEPANHVKNECLKNSLRSQGTLARYAVPELKIHGMSLNHQKAIAEIVLGNFGVLNALRKAATNALVNEASRTARGNSTSKNGLLARVRELEADRSLLLQDLYLLQRAYDLRCLQARNYAHAADAATQSRCAKEQKELDTSFSLRKKPIDTGKVTSLSEVKKRVRQIP